MPVNLNSEKYEKFVRALMVGGTGRGKTIAAASWPGKTLVLDFDNRHKPIFDWFNERVKLGDFDVETITPTNFWTVFKPLIDKLCQFNPYANVLLDGITTLSTTSIVMQMLAKGSFANWYGKKEANAEEGRGSKITAGGIMVPGWDEFNGEAMIISTLLETLKSLKCNLFVTAHPVLRTRINEKKKASSYYSITTFGPKVESIIPTYFDEVWYFDYKVESDNQGKEIIQRTCYTQPCEDYLEAKTSMKLPKELDYTDKNLYELMKDYL